eukprot:6106600-Pyramimonas_sp.AAC.1
MVQTPTAVSFPALYCSSRYRLSPMPLSTLASASPREGSIANSSAAARPDAMSTDEGWQCTSG